MPTSFLHIHIHIVQCADAPYQFHAYEGHPLSSVIFPVRVLAALGVRELISASSPFPLSILLPCD